MTGVPAVLTLVPKSVEQEFVAESAQDELVELLLNEFVSIHFVNFFLALSDSALTTETADGFQRPLSDVLLGWVTLAHQDLVSVGETH